MNYGHLTGKERWIGRIARLPGLPWYDRLPWRMVEGNGMAPEMRACGCAAVVVIRGMAGNPDAKAKLALTRLAYLYGTGNGAVPVRDKAKLLQMSGVDRNTLTRHMEIWNAENEEIVRSAAKNPFGLALREGTVEAHKADVDWLRNQMDVVKNEVDNLDDILAELWEYLHEIKENALLTTDEYEPLCRLLEDYLKTSMNRKSLLTLFLSLQARWQDSSAMNGTLAAFTTHQKEVAKHKAKQEFAAQAGDQGDRPIDAGARAKESAVFKRQAG